MISLPKQLVVIGDSSVYGWGDNEGGGWCERLRKDWCNNQNGPVIYQLGVRGDGIEKVSSRWEKEWSSRGETRRNKPKAILLNVGLNDTAAIGQKNGRHQLDIDGFEYGLERLINEMNSQTNVFVIGLTPVDESKMPFAGCLWYSNDFCNWLLDEHYIAFVPGEVFGAEGYLRCSYALGEKDLKEGLTRFSEAVKDL